MQRTGGTTRSQKKAFTLIELLAVVVIMGIIAGVAIMMAGNDDIYYAAGTARMAEQIIEYAQQEAVRSQRDIMVIFLADIEYIGVYSSSGVLPNPFGSGNLFLNIRNEISSRCYLDTVNLGSGSNWMFFDKYGEPQRAESYSLPTRIPISDSNYVIFGCGNKKFKVAIKPVTGTVRVTKYN